MANNRMTFPFTQREIFEGLISLLQNGECVYTHTKKNGDKETVRPNPEKVIEFLTYKINQLDKPAGEHKLTPQQKKNEIVKAAILENMEPGKKYTITDMIANFDCFTSATTPQYVSALLTQMGDNKGRGTNEVKRTIEKGKAYFSLA